MRKSAAVTAALLVVAIAGMALTVGCAKTFIGKAEQAYSVLADTCNAWFTFEKQNRDFCEKYIPGSHAKTEEMRREVPKVLDSLEVAINTYRDLQKRGSGVSPAQKELAAAEVTEQLAALSRYAGLCQHYVDTMAAAKGGER